MTIDVGAVRNPYLAGQHAPVTDELDVADLPVSGTIPAALQGAYLRNGPNPQFAPLGGYHLFDGDGMIHAVDLRDGTARYRNRWIESRGLLAERRAGHARYGGLSDFRMPDAELADEGGMLKNTANTHVVRHAGRTLALLEAAPPTELAPDLATLGEWDFGGALQGAMTAHPKLDPDTGELLFFGYSPFPPYVRFHVVDAAGTLVRSDAVDLPRAVMMHDFAVTSRRVVLFDLPAIFDVHAMLSGGAGIRWEPEAGARIGVFDRDGSAADIRWIEVDPFYVFHFLNAYDDGDAVVVDGCRSDRLPITFGPDRLDEKVEPVLHRWRIDLAAGTVTDQPLDDEPGDFPRIDDRRAGKAARFGYVVHASGRPDADIEFDGIVKHDLAAGTSELFRYGPGCVAGEAVFAADPDRDGEDAGWLLNFVHDQVEGRSSLVIVDAQALEAVATVHLPRRVPFGFHGNWMPDHQA